MATSTSSSSASQSQNAGSNFPTFLQPSFDGLSFDTEADRQDINKVLEKLEAYCIGETNETYERYVFNKRDQQQGESFDSYLSALRSLIKTCNFGTLQDNLLRDRVVLGIRENSTRKKLLAESKLTLEKCISICRANETTSKQLQEIASEEVNAINSARRPSHSTENPPSKRTAATGVPRNKGSGPGQRRESQIKCKFCLKTHEKKKESCFVWNKSCNACGISNHFLGSSVCRGKKKTGSGVVHTVEKFNDRMIISFISSHQTLSTAKFLQVCSYEMNKFNFS